MFSVNFSQERENQTNGLFLICHQTMDLTHIMPGVRDYEAACFFLPLNV